MEPDPKKSDFFPTNHEPYPNFSIGGHNLFHTFLELPPKKRTSSRQIMSLTLISVYQAIFSSILFWSYLWKNQISFPQFMSMNLISESYTEKVWAFLYYSDHSKTTQIWIQNQNHLLYSKPFTQVNPFLYKLDFFPINYTFFLYIRFISFTYYTLSWFLPFFQ